jgi:hypothetical protein
VLTAFRRHSKWNRNLGANVVAATSTSATTTLTPETTATTAKHAAQQIFHVKLHATTASSETLKWVSASKRLASARGRMPKLVVLLTFLLVAEHIPRFRDLSKLLRGFGILIVGVRVVLAGQLLVSLPQFFLRSTARNSQNIVIVTF